MASFSAILRSLLSNGAVLQCMAAQNGARQIKNRLTDFAAEKYQVPRDQVLFLPNRVRIGNQEIAFADLVKQAYMARIQLSAAGFYKTPKIHWNRDKGEGRPFYYFAYGASCSEVSVDTLTGEYVVERTDILHETGRSLNRAIDLGQIEGGFIQGMRAAGVDAKAMLAGNNAWTAFNAVGDLFVPGPTGTNVNDLRAILIR